MCFSVTTRNGNDAGCYETSTVVRDDECECKGSSPGIAPKKLISADPQLAKLFIGIVSLGKKKKRPNATKCSESNYIGYVDADMDVKPPPPATRKPSGKPQNPGQPGGKDGKPGETTGPVGDSVTPDEKQEPLKYVLIGLPLLILLIIATCVAIYCWRRSGSGP
ncbi:unnamed protein product, partial [Mesorhabditis spiculigera]